MNQQDSSQRFYGAWKRISRRVRVPLGFFFVVFYFWLALPKPGSLLESLLLVVPGLLLRSYASGYVKKNSELTTTGPYAYTRNPLYLGSILIAFGFSLAACSLLVVLALALLFIIIYLPVILAEEEYLRAHFTDYDEYKNRVPRLIPRVFFMPQNDRAAFSFELYVQHREYNSLLGTFCIYLVLIVRMVVWHRYF